MPLAAPSDGDDNSQTTDASADVLEGDNAAVSDDEEDPEGQEECQVRHDVRPVGVLDAVPHESNRFSYMGQEDQSPALDLLE